ncbi:MAG: lysine--tRNA ligase, partial [Candidatus Ryanbacteria bacterium]|nr:lysine--tRNA ligase [Candidatus Ryanbacteria bacterium]
ANDRAREIFILRAKALGFIRSYFEKNGFIEVETPVLQHIPGGATARPFATHHNALDIPLYLRVAPELYLKRLVVGGFDRVFEIARNFRNEGIDVTHNPEFTMLEAYMAYSDYKSLMHFLEEFIKKLFSTVIKQKLPKQFKRISFYDTLRQYALMPHIETMPDKDIEIAAKRFGVPTEGKRNSELLEDIFRKAARPHLSAPTFVLDWPRELLPLAKAKPDAPHIAESFQLYIKGIELIKGFSELNDPKMQRELFMKQEDLRKKGDEEAQRIDEDFIQNLEYGMPPTAGFGIGIDRLMLVLADTPNVREVILFPTMRSKNR